jgi:hypothetical protein
MLHSDELFLFFAQVGKYAAIRDDGTGRPDFRVPEFEKAYRDFILSIQNLSQLNVLSNEVFQILKRLITFDYLHDRVEAYIKTENELRKENMPHLNYDVEKLEAEMKMARSLFEAQYSKELKSKLRPENIPDDLLTRTGGRIVRLKDYLFHQGPSSKIPSVVMLNHQGREVLWPD